jgi:YbbR domain-containing protein
MKILSFLAALFLFVSCASKKAFDPNSYVFAEASIETVER